MQVNETLSEFLLRPSVHSGQGTRREVSHHKASCDRMIPMQFLFKIAKRQQLKLRFACL